MDKKNYQISIYTENKLGLLNRISSVFLKRRINIERLSVAETETKNLSLFKVEINVSEEKVYNTVKQLEKQVEVISVKCDLKKLGDCLELEQNF